MGVEGPYGVQRHEAGTAQAVGDHVSRGQAAGEFGAGDRLEVCGVAQPDAGGLAYVGQQVMGEIFDLLCQQGEAWVGELVENARARPPRDHRLRGRECLELRGGVADPHHCGRGQVLHPSFALGQQVQQVQPRRRGQCLGDPGELRIQRRLRRCGLRPDTFDEGTPILFGSP
jgi:hypothetical protein